MTTEEGAFAIGFLGGRDSAQTLEKEKQEVALGKHSLMLATKITDETDSSIYIVGSFAFNLTVICDEGVYFTEYNLTCPGVKDWCAENYRLNGTGGEACSNFDNCKT